MEPPAAGGGGNSHTACPRRVVTENSDRWRGSELCAATAFSHELSEHLGQGEA